MCQFLVWIREVARMNTGNQSSDNISSIRGHQWLIRRVITFAPKAACCAVFVGAFVLLSYGFEALQTFFSLKQSSLGNPWVAFCFIIIGLATIMMRIRHSRNIIEILSGLVVTIAVIQTIFIFIGIWDVAKYSGFWHYALSIGIVYPLPGSIMDIQATMLILLNGIALLLLKARRIRASQITALLACIPLIAALAGFIYGIPEFYGSMPLLTILGGVFCSLAVLPQTAQSRPLRDVLAIGDFGRIIRYQSLILVLSSILLAFLVVQPDINERFRLLPILVTSMVIIYILREIYSKTSRTGRRRSAALRQEYIIEHPLLSSLRGAWERGEMFIVYQPQIDMATDKIIGVETLLRWRHVEQGLISPEIFIPLAEESGLIVPLGAWVLQNACEEAKGWHSGPLAGIVISVNVSSIQLNQVGFYEVVMNILRATELAPQRLVLEVTESTMIKKGTYALEALHQLHMKQVHIAIDDFGTGYSSLSYLRLLPSDYLKIDQSFVKELPNDEGATVIARTIVAMGRSLGMRVIAEGIETAEQADFLKSIWCDEGQGYFYAHPMIAADLQVWAEARAARNC